MSDDHNVLGMRPEGSESGGSSMLLEQNSRYRYDFRSTQ